MELGDPMKTVKALVGDKVLKSDRCCGESGTLGVTRPDISTQVRFRKEEEIRKGEAQLRASGAVEAQGNIKILTSCPSCLQGIKRYEDDLSTGLLEADYIVVEMARQILGEQWLSGDVRRANRGGVERVLVRLDRDNLADGVELASAAAEIGGYGPVKEASVARYEERLKGLLEAFDAPTPAASALRVQLLS